MTDEKRAEKIDMLLSREELLLLLDLLRVHTIPGLDADPLGELNDDQHRMALIWAERALRARQLATFDEGGKLLVDQRLLTAVSSCAYSQKAIFAYHWAGNADNPQHYFGHLRDETAVVHSRPDEVLHLFTLLPSIADLIEGITAVCQLKDNANTPSLEFTIPQDIFVRIRELADDKATTEAAALLGENGVEMGAGRPFVNTLSNDSNMTILQIVQQDAGEITQKEELTVIQNALYSWAIIPDGDNLRIKTINAAEFQSLINEKI